MSRALHWVKTNYWLTSILVLAAVLRVYHIDFQNLWLDEVLSMNDASPKLSWSQSYDSVMKWEGFPALYFMLLKVWMYIFGFTGFSARIFSALIGVLGVYGIYLFGKEFMNKRVGLIVALLTCVNYLHIFYSQEIRPYGMFFLFTVLAFYRLSVLIKKPTIRNGIYYGVFAGLMVNAHLVGLLTVFAQMLILLLFLVKTPKDSRKNFFVSAFAGGLAILILFLPCIKTFNEVSGIKSFWIPDPKPDSFTIMFREFFGHSEMLIFLFSAVALYYFIVLFRQKMPNESLQEILDNKMVYTFTFLFIWIVVLLVIPVIKSYTDVSILLTRYFINMLAMLLIVIAIGIDLIKSRMVTIAVISATVLFSMLDLFIIKDYYNTPTKTQYRELVNDLISKNTDKAKVVAFWTWIFPYFVPEGEHLQFEQALNIEDYVLKLKRGEAPERAFWFTDANGRPFMLNPEAQAYLDEKFILKHKLEYIDVWAHYYVPKNAPAIDIGNIDLTTFNRATFDAKGNIAFFNNGVVQSPLLKLESGRYDLVISGMSYPEKPIKGENAHIVAKLAGKEIAQFYLSQSPGTNEKVIEFTIDAPVTGRLSLAFDNDAFLDGADRNATISFVGIRKK